MRRAVKTIGSVAALLLVLNEIRGAAMVGAVLWPVLRELLKLPPFNWH